MHEELEYIENHAIVLGYGDVGRRVVKRLTKAGVLFVVIDTDEKVFQDADFSYMVVLYQHDGFLGFLVAGLFYGRVL
jgi:voltage-gated potassium channel Kch